MKNINTLVALAVLFNSGMALANNSIELSADQVHQMNLTTLEQSFVTVSPLDLIDWKVGDSMTYDILAAGFGNMGTMDKAVTKDEGTAIWIKQNMAMMGQKEVIEMLISKADGKVLKMLRNGKEQAIPDDKVEIISQDYTEVKVPAGTFKCLHIVAKTKDVNQLEIWANPRDTVMDGGLRTKVDTNMIDLDLQLTKFKKM